MITTDEIAQAETEAERARGELAAVEREFARGGISTHSHTRLADARDAAEHATVRLSVMREDFARQETDREAREAAGRVAAASMAGTAKQLAASRGAAAQAVADAEAAIRCALSAVAAHDKALRAAAADLRARGLRADDGEDTGGRMDGGLRLGGEQWLPVDAPSLLASAFASVVGEACPGHPLGRGAQVTFGGVVAVAGRDDLLSRVPGRKRAAA